jgi:hypothetical protein
MAYKLRIVNETKLKANTALTVDLNPMARD